MIVGLYFDATANAEVQMTVMKCTLSQSCDDYCPSFSSVESTVVGTRLNVDQRSSDK